MALHSSGDGTAARSTGWRRAIVPGLIVTATLAAAATVVTAGVFEQLRGHDRAIAFAEGRMRAAVGELASTVAARFVGMDSDLIAIVNGLEYAEGEFHFGATSTMMARLRLSEGRGAEFIVVDALGHIVLDSEQRRIVGPIIADRAYFRHHRTDTSPLPFLVWVDASNVTGRAIFGVSRRIEDTYGTFGGVVAAGIDPAALIPALDTAMRDRYASSALYLRDGTLVLRRPNPDGSSGHVRVAGRLFRDEIPGGPGGKFEEFLSRLES